MATFSHLSRNSLGAISAVAAATCFSINDTAIKAMSAGYALPQMMFLRSIVALAVILFIFAPIARDRVRLRSNRHGILFVRGVLMVFANLFFFLGLALVPLADNVGVFFICPLIILALSVLFLGETAGPRRWFAVVLGLFGVVIMMRPGADGFNAALIFPLLGAVSYATLHVVTRGVGEAINASTMALYLQITFFVAMGLLGLAFGDGRFDGAGGELFAFLMRPWIWPPVDHIWLFLLTGFATAGSNYFVSQAYRLGEASLVAPLEYVALPLGVFFGVLVFGDWPSLNNWIGMTFIVGAGLFVIWRENLAAKAPTPPSHPQ